MPPSWFGVETQPLENPHLFDLPLSRAGLMRQQGIPFPPGGQDESYTLFEAEPTPMGRVPRGIRWEAPPSLFDRWREFARSGISERPVSYHPEATPTVPKGPPLSARALAMLPGWLASAVGAYGGQLTADAVYGRPAQVAATRHFTDSYGPWATNAEAYLEALPGRALSAARSFITPTVPATIPETPPGQSWLYSH